MNRRMILIKHNQDGIHKEINVLYLTLFVARDKV